MSKSTRDQRDSRYVRSNPGPIEEKSPLVQESSRIPIPHHTHPEMARLKAFQSAGWPCSEEEEVSIAVDGRLKTRREVSASQEPTLDIAPHVGCKHWKRDEQGQSVEQASDPLHTCDVRTTSRGGFVNGFDNGFVDDSVVLPGIIIADRGDRREGRDAVIPAGVGRGRHSE
ncbi:hypothetical protein NX059_012429 [Plenodomus lindquistii]|nr:hypothetical protein NX059_012429 [Plenodomus lindquistii]